MGSDKADVIKEDAVVITDNNNIPLKSVNVTRDDDDLDEVWTIAQGFDCDRCWFHCKDTKEFKVHQKTHKIKGEPKYVSPPKELFNFICDKCPTEMCNWEQYKRHYWYNHTYNFIKCSYDECKDLIFQNSSKLRKHIQLKHCLEKPTCFFCNKKYSSK